MTSSRPMASAIVVISDFVERPGPFADHFGVGFGGPAPSVPTSADSAADQIAVVGGYLERLPLAAVHTGLVTHAEIWHHWLSPSTPPYRQDSTVLARRGFRLDGDHAPMHSEAMIAFIKQFGAPKILCVWGLGVSEAVLEACRESVIIYNSIDAPALRVPPETSRHFDLVLTGAQWQSDVVNDRHPEMATSIMPIGPEFASAETFFPIDCPKIYDVVYVAAAQPYKRHDVLFEALRRSPRPLKALCVIGYGELSDHLRHRAAELGLDVEFVGPPGVPHSEVNRLMNLARVGVVCGVDDGAPAILTEYMLAGLPVVANSALTCGLQFILPQNGLAADADQFETAIIHVLDHLDDYAPRQSVLERWTWPHTISKFSQVLSGLDRAEPDTGPADFALSSTPMISKGGTFVRTNTAE